MAIKSKVIVSSHSSLDSDLADWLEEAGEIEVVQMTQSQSYHGKPRAGTNHLEEAEYAAGEPTVIVTILYHPSPYTPSPVATSFSEYVAQRKIQRR